MDDDFNFTRRFPEEDDVVTGPQEDDSWLDKEIEQEQDAHMKTTMIRVKQTMVLQDNETKRNFIFEERKRVVEREQYANDINSTQGFEVGEYPYLSRLGGGFITRYYCPPETTITDYELDKLTSFANLAIGEYNNITHNTEFGNVLVIKAMRCLRGLPGRGHYYYLTFQASLPDHPPQMFESQLCDASPGVTILFVRLKMPKQPQSWIRTPRPEEDDSWLDKEIEQEQDAFMKEVLIDVKRTMKRRTNEAKRNYIFEERKRIAEREQYAKDLNSTQGFEVGEYPYLSRQLVGSFITRYYCPPETTITDYELDKLTSFANLAIGQYNITQNPYTEFGNVLVIKAMRSFSCGHWYYLTFQASLPDHPPQMFEAKVYDEPHWVSPPVTIQFVRCKKHQPN